MSEDIHHLATSRKARQPMSAIEQHGTSRDAHLFFS